MKILIFYLLTMIVNFPIIFIDLKKRLDSRKVFNDPVKDNLNNRLIIIKIGLVVCTLFWPLYMIGLFKRLVLKEEDTLY